MSVCKGIMTNLSNDEVKHIAKLSRLELTQEEIDKYTDQLSSVLEYVEKLNEVNTGDTEPTANIAGLNDVFRDDEVVVSGISHEEIGKNAPEFKDGLLVVPGVFE